MARYGKTREGEVMTMKPGKPLRLCCCDCGLVHQVEVSILPNGRVGLAFFRKNRSTAQMRRHGQTGLQRNRIRSYRMVSEK